MTNNQDRLIPLELTLDDWCWLRAFLKEERLSADADYKKVEALHNEMAIRAAQKMLSSEHARLTKIVTEITETLEAIDKREAIARMIATTTPGHPLVD